jgi:CheY-like chemotaxis protein
VAPLKLSESVSEALKMMRSLIPANIKVEEYYADSGLILSSSTYIHQIIMNLLNNAVHAMDKDGGVLEVRLTREYMDEQRAARELQLPSGPYLKMTICDSGHGMTPEVSARVFEPYFTTKEAGRGTGLGLSVVHGIVKSHGGAIVCRSAQGTGTSFDVYFPEVEDRRKPEDAREEDVMPTGTETILYVDDEQALGEIAGEMLESLGYQVIVKTSSMEAYHFFAAAPERVDAVITDMSMPQLTGDKLAHKMLELRPDLPIIICTGYSEHISRAEAARLGIREFLMKPFEMVQLAYAVRRTIDGKCLAAIQDSGQYPVPNDG